MQRSKFSRARLMCSAAAVAMAIPLAAHAQTAEFNIAAQPLTSALKEFGLQSRYTVVAQPDVVASKTSRGVSQSTEPEIALAQLLQGTGLGYRREGDTFLIVRAEADPQSGSAAGSEVEALIVTAQKREEDIQDVPIAISAFTQEALERSQIAGGPDLMTQVPNMTFTRTNFTGYSIQIRGIGTQAISATTDPAVAVAFNNTPFVRNRLFEQEFYDLQRVEVLRGPQGTLYGRNATAGVVNIISAKPSFNYEAKLSADVGNYNSTRLEGMINLPLAEDAAALRLAGAWTKRDGFVTNALKGAPTDGRDLWSTRLSLRVAPPNAPFDVNLIWEHFEEDDDRLRSGKQLCKTDEVTEMAGFPVSHFTVMPSNGQTNTLLNGAQASWSQGCAPASLYSPEAFQTPNGLALPYYFPLNAVFLPGALLDPYTSRSQSRDLREIESTIDPTYRAKSDILEIQAEIELTDSLSLASETAWASDFIFSTQDLNRFNTAAGAWDQPGNVDREGVLLEGPVGGIFCDPQIGCADRLVGMDLSTARSQHFSQELRLASDYDGPFNFSLGANFLRYDTEDKYYVFINSLSLISSIAPFDVQGELPPYVGGVTDNRECLSRGSQFPDPTTAQPILRCTYIDPNPIENLNDLGHNYFLSRNPYKLISYAVFGEAYYNLAENLKLTAGLRWTVDKKEAPRIPSWVLASTTVGYPVDEVVEQEWREPTGRLAVDWKPALSFTDETLLYASYAHGYKAGGANPPPYGVAVFNSGEAIVEKSVAHPRTFEAEFIDAFELGAKNTLLDGRVTLNLGAFYYDYTGYQISQIVNRSAANFNFDATVAGFEVEADWRPQENLRFGLKLGYEDTKVADGEEAIDLMDRTGGRRGWTVVKPFPGIPSNCILPEWLFIGNTASVAANPELVALGAIAGGLEGPCEEAYLLGKDPVTREDYVANPLNSVLPFTHAGVINYTAISTDPADFPGWPEGLPITDRRYPGWDPSTAPNNGEGFFSDLSGNELPNAPNWTATLTGDYTVPLAGDWLLTLHTDVYYQSEAWTRIFNMEGYDKLKAYTNVNLAAILNNDEGGWRIMAYVKNVMDRDSITGAFLFSDDTALTTNVFLTEPRLYGLRVTKEWSGGPWWTGANPDHPAGEPYPLTVELSGQVQRHDAPYQPLNPGFIDSFSEQLNTLDAVQNRDLDWGDGRQVKLTYRPDGSLWSVSAAMRYGRTNSETARLHATEEGETGCANAGSYYGALCGQPSSGLSTSEHWTDTAASNRERHTVVDFDIGRDVGLGSFSGSSLRGGLRYAQLKSSTSAWIDGNPGWDVPTPADPYWTSFRYESALDAEREFEGVGPMLSWAAALKLLGDDQVGRMDLDWSVSGGMLFGKQKTDIVSDEVISYQRTDKYDSFKGIPPISTEPAIVEVHRSDSAAVPVADVSVGLSYEIGRLKLGTGYRWERYFDALDAGGDEKADADRTIDGPYFKLSVGFGG